MAHSLGLFLFRPSCEPLRDWMGTPGASPGSEPFISAPPFWTHGYHGLLADTRIYDTALSPEDILALFTSTPVAQLVDSLDQGIPDVWALFFSLNPWDPTLASQVLQPDSFSNLQKYRLGMNPTKTAQVSPKPLLKVYTPLEK